MGDPYNKFLESLARIQIASNEALSTTRAAATELEDRLSGTVASAFDESATAREVKLRTKEMLKLKLITDPLLLGTGVASPGTAAPLGTRTSNARGPSSPVHSPPLRNPAPVTPSDVDEQSQRQSRPRTSRSSTSGTTTGRPTARSSQSARRGPSADPAASRAYAGSTWAWDRHTADLSPVPLTSQDSREDARRRRQKRAAEQAEAARRTALREFEQKHRELAARTQEAMDARLAALFAETRGRVHGLLATEALEKMDRARERPAEEWSAALAKTAVEVMAQVRRRGACVCASGAGMR